MVRMQYGPLTGNCKCRGAISLAALYSLFQIYNLIICSVCRTEFGYQRRRLCVQWARVCFLSLLHFFV